MRGFLDKPPGHVKCFLLQKGRERQKEAKRPFCPLALFASA
jgi:hypothetical protein